MTRPAGCASHVAISALARGLAFVWLLLGGACSKGGPPEVDHATPPTGAYVPSASPVPKGHRRLGIDVNESANHDYGAALAAAKSAGVENVSLSQNWDTLETAPNTFAPNPNFLAIANAYYPPQKIRVNLILRPMDTTGKQVPADLKKRRMNDPVVIERFNHLTDFVFSQIPNLQLGCLAIGNEIDLGLGDNAEAWTDYAEFYEKTAAYVKHKHPDLRVGTTSGFEGLTSKHREQLNAINQHSDVVLVTYYPLNQDFTVRDPSVVSNDFAAVVKLYPAKPIYFEEAGYPSSTVIKSSLEKQRQFVREVFQAWDRYPDQIELVMFTWLTDSSPEKLSGFKKYYGLGDTRFMEYLRSLGLRTYPGAGANKPAFEALRIEAHLRGW